MTGIAGISGTGFSLGESAAILDKINNNPDIRKLDLDISSMESKKDNIEIALRLPRDERLARFKRENSSSYYRIGNYEFERQKDIGMCVGVGTGLAVGALLAAGALLKIIPSPIASLLGSMVGLGGALLPFVYLKAAKKWIIPAKVDKEVTGELKGEQKSLERSLERKKASRSNLINRIVEEEKKQHPLLEVEEDGDYVSIGGIRLKRNPREDKNNAESVFKYINPAFIPVKEGSGRNWDGTR